MAREFALKKSKSEYVVFLDSDDLFYNCYSLERLYEKVIVGNDYVVGKFFNEHTNKTSYSYGDLHGKLYRRSFLEDKNVFFPISRVHEDNFFNNLVCVNSPITSYVWETVYVYCENELSISSVSNEVQFQRLKVWFENVDLILEYAFKNKCNSICIKQIIYEKTRYLCDIYKNLFVDKKEKLRKMVDNSVLDSKYLEFTDYDLLKEAIFNENLDKYICYFSF